VSLSRISAVPQASHAFRQSLALVCFEDVQAPKPEIHGPGKTHSRPTVRRSRLARQRGFSLVELLIMCAIVMTIFAIAIPSLLAAVDQARIARAVGDIKAIEDDIASYQATNNDQLPDSLSQVGDDALLDPWGVPYQYVNHSTTKGNGQARKDRFLVPLNSDYDLYSSGKDMRSVGPITANVSQDDIIRADSGNYVGLASQF
jgi:general secretion pathway protein G